MSPRQQLTPKATSIVSVTVTVKSVSLSPSDEQIPLAIFQQLRDKPLYKDLTLEPRGWPLYRVNHHFGSCARVSEHEHVVWHESGELWRDLIVRPSEDLCEMPVLGYDDEVAVCATAGGIPEIQVGRSEASSAGRSRLAGYNLYIYGEFRGRTVRAKLCIGSRELARKIIYGGTRKVSLVHERIHPGGIGCGEAAAIFAQRIEHYATWQANAWLRWQEVRTLPQVIAV